MIVKVCGMGDSAIMHQHSTLKIDMLGFIFYPRSPRFVVGKIEPKEITKLPSSIKKTGVFVNAGIETILDYAKSFHLDTIQLHGNETPELCEALKAKGFGVLKAFNLTKNNNFEAYEPYCDYFIFDTPSEQHGGTGEKFDWTLLNNYTAEIPFLLSGGIGPEDAKEVLQIQHPQMAGIDINSKF
jgi:phosphoribosylanthranilate isomerase